MRKYSEKIEESFIRFVFKTYTYTQKTRESLITFMEKIEESLITFMKKINADRAEKLGDSCVREIGLENGCTSRDAGDFYLDSLLINASAGRKEDFARVKAKFDENHGKFYSILGSERVNERENLRSLIPLCELTQEARDFIKTELQGYKVLTELSEVGLRF